MTRKMAKVKSADTTYCRKRAVRWYERGFAPQLLKVVGFLFLKVKHAGDQVCRATDKGL